VLGQDFPPYDNPPPTPVRVAKRRIVMPLLSRAIGGDKHNHSLDPTELFDVNELTDALMQAELAKPIESWMTFLHPSQLKLVNTSYSGPSRVRGPAGTGKTVVGLHRAAYLAERNPKRVLFVTFVRTLPIVMSGLCRRMSPVAADNIEFTNLHRLAIDIVEKAGARSRIDGQKARKAFYAAWTAVAKGSVLTKLDARPSYWQEEIDYVIKGRGLTDFEEYAALSRVGRRTPMRVDHRATMWELYVEYERQLGLAGVHDFTDVLILARDFVRDGAVAPDYGAVVVDEVQDLNLVGLQLLHAIAGDGPDALMVIGDGQQAVYPGGFTLTEAGISVTGRAAVLRSNYRNTVEVLEAAAQVISRDQYDDLDGEPLAGQRDIEAVRRGGSVLTVRAADRASLEAALVKQIKETERILRVPLGDLAVLVATRKDLEHYSAVLRRARISHVDLRDYDGVSSDHVKIGTFKRAKGLEFKYALLPGLTDGPRRAQPGESDESYRERMERGRRELYVGMTRARDGLWLGYVRD
jgi:superfamily I DNA/RNA helicase